MIGQIHNIDFINNCVKECRLPRLLLIRGEQGSGKKTLANYISKTSGFDIVWFTPTVDSVRTLINTAYTQTKPIIYAISDCDKLSMQGANALLKVAEEPPANTYIILTVNNDSLLGTIKSRGTLISMEPYSEQEKQQYAQDLGITNNVKEKIASANNLGELLILENCDFDGITKLVDNIVNNIRSANIGSVLKITNKIKLKEKDDDSLFDLSIFINILLNKYFEYAQQPKFTKYAERCWNCVFNAKQQLGKSYNKQYVLDEMLLTLREVK